MPMIDVYARAGMFDDRHALARCLAGAVMVVEEVPDIPMFRDNTAAFIHELPADAISNMDGSSDYVRVQVLTNAGALNRSKQIALVARLTKLIAARQATHLRRSGSGCCSPRHPRAGGVCGATRTPMKNWSPRRAARSLR